MPLPLGSADLFSPRQSEGNPRRKAGRGSLAQAAVVARQPLRQAMQVLFAGLFAMLMAVTLLAQPARSADRDKIAAFLTVTGYDVVIDSLQLGAMSAPAMAGDSSERFAKLYADLAREVFDPAVMRERALDLLGKMLSDDLLHAGAEFYASELGQRLVEVENASHMVSYETRQAEGLAIVSQLQNRDRRRLEVLRRMQSALGGEELMIQGMIEVQVRFLLAAREAGAQKLEMSEAELRIRLRQLALQRLPQSRREGLISSAWTYRDISDADLIAYTKALSSPELTQLYDVLNKVQYLVMIEFYEKLGLRLAEVAPERDL